jgi:transketolase
MAALQWDPIDSTANEHRSHRRRMPSREVEKWAPGAAMSLAPAACSSRRSCAATRVTIPGSGVTASSSQWGTPRSPRYVQLYFGGYGLELGDLRHSAPGAPRPPPPRIRPHRRDRDHHGPSRPGDCPSAVGFAYASRFEEGGPVRPGRRWGTSPFDHYIYAIAGDGDMQEGVTSGILSRGHQKLGNLTAIYDSNPDLDRRRHQHRLRRQTSRRVTRRTLARAGGRLEEDRTVRRGTSQLNAMPSARAQRARPPNPL